MSRVQNISFHENETWKIDFVAHDANDVIIPLVSGTELDFRIKDPDGNIILTLGLGTGVNITNADGGAAEIIIPVELQIEHGLTVGKEFFYEIRLIEGEDLSIQAEGLLTVSRSLFGATPADPLVEQFHFMLPEFEEAESDISDTAISMALQMAGRVVDGDPSWPVADKVAAKVYLAAHMLQMSRAAAQQFSSGALTTGPVRSLRVEDRMVMFSDTSRAANARIGLNQTIYGQLYLSMMRRNTHFVMRA